MGLTYGSIIIVLGFYISFYIALTFSRYIYYQKKIKNKKLLYVLNMLYSKLSPYFPNRKIYLCSLIERYSNFLFKNFDEASLLKIL